MPVMRDEDHGNAEPALWRREGAFIAPRPGLWDWLRDPHAVAAMLGAVPAWAGLALFAGGHMSAPSTVASWLSLVGVHPLVEEVLFRGLLHGQLLRLTRGGRAGEITLANIGTTMAFVMVHLAVQPAPWAIAVAAPSLVLGHLRERFASVLPAIVMHAYYNAGFGLIAWWLHQDAL